MFYINVWLTVQEADRVQEIRGLLAECAKQSRREAGCERFEVFHSQANPRQFLLCEQWAEKSDWEVHRTGQAFTQIYQPRVLPHVTREPHICDAVL